MTTHMERENKGKESFNLCAGEDNHAGGTATVSCHVMATTNRTRETPYQDFSRIRKGVLKRRACTGYTAFEDLFTDPSFPPDWSSLTYVYSGDDKYERTVFKRPPEVQNNPVFIGVGGVPEEPFPWRHWRQRAWFQAAINILSMNVRFLDKFVPGYRNHEQNFGEDYIGAFHFYIWRFGEWVDIIVDDYLPWLDDGHFFCKAIGKPPEFWAPLAEKAYAKCKKTFQAIEFGYLLDALTDLTGAICEFFTPDVNPPENLFHIMYKSSLNRSMVVCWRNDKRLTSAAFDVDERQREADPDIEDRRHLHLVTATTKFPCKDGHTIEMIRLKCPFSKEPKWRGKYSEFDTMSWNMINSEFNERYQPLSRKEEDEYWLQMDDFRCNFGGLIIISGHEPYSQEGLNVIRRYHTANTTCVRKDQKSVTPTQNPQFKKQSAPYLGHVMNRSTETTAGGNARVSPLAQVTSCSSVDNQEKHSVSSDMCEVLSLEDETEHTEFWTRKDDNSFNSEEDIRANVDRKVTCSPLFEVVMSSNERRNREEADDVGKYERKYLNFVVEKTKSTSTDQSLDGVLCDVRTKVYPEKENISNGVRNNSSLISKFSPRILRRKKTAIVESCPQSTSNNGYTSPLEENRNTGESPFVDVAQNTPYNCAMNLESKPPVSNKYNHVDKVSHDTQAHHVTCRQYRRTERKQPSVPNLRKSNYDQYFARKISLPQLPNAAFHLPNKAENNNSRRSSTPLNSECSGRRRLDSAASVSTVYSEARSCYSASEISIHIRSQLSMDDSGRPMSAPLNRNLSSGSLNSLTQSNFLATKADYFKSHGRWSCIVDHRGKWTKIRKGISRVNLDEHSKNPRIMFAVAKTEVTDCVAVGLQGKRHVLISVLQDYRHGPSTANSLLVPIGFCLYKAKHPDRDEKRHVSKLHLIGQVDGKSEMREVHSRFDVDPGCYFVIPYYMAQSHEGEFIVRVLAEGDPAGGKAGCMVS